MSLQTICVRPSLPLSLFFFSVPFAFIFKLKQYCLYSCKFSVMLIAIMLKCAVAAVSSADAWFYKVNAWCHYAQDFCSKFIDSLSRSMNDTYAHMQTSYKARQCFRSGISGELSQLHSHGHLNSIWTDDCHASCILVLIRMGRRDVIWQIPAGFVNNSHPQLQSGKETAFTAVQLPEWWFGWKSNVIAFCWSLDRWLHHWATDGSGWAFVTLKHKIVYKSNIWFVHEEH